MRAIVWAGPHEACARDVPAPQLQAGSDALVRVECASTCGTDVHAYRGAVPGFEPGTILGHEFVGVVEAVGHAVTRFAPGMRVWSACAATCGGCLWCRTRRAAQCESRMLFGFSGIQPRLDGALAEQVRVPWADRSLCAMSEDDDPRGGLLATDVLPAALGALERLRLARGDRLVVVGSGAVGVAASCVARHRGLSVVALDSSPARVARAQAAGIESYCVEPEVPGAAVLEIIGGFADGAIDAVGGQHGLERAIALVRPGGGHVVGVGAQIKSYAIDWGRALQREISISFTVGDAAGIRDDVLRVLGEGFLPLDALFSDSVPLAEIPGYYPKLLRREAFKAVVRVGQRQRAVPA